MSTIKEFLIRVEAYAAISEQSVSTLSRKLLNDGKGISRLRAGGQCTLKTLNTALTRLENYERELIRKDGVNMSH